MLLIISTLPKPLDLQSAIRVQVLKDEAVEFSVDELSFISANTKQKSPMMWKEY
jgi:hypothetical protein